MQRRILSLVLALVLALGIGFPAVAGNFSYTSGPAKMRIDVITPEGTPAKALVLVLHTSGGHKQADDDYARKLVAQGYATAVPHFLAAYGIEPKQRRRTWTQFRGTLLTGFRRIADEVASRTGIPRPRVYAVGFSNGGYWAAYLAGKGIVAKGISYYGAVTEAGTDRVLDNISAALAVPGGAVLFLHGTEDETVGVGAIRRLQRKIGAARATFVYYEGAGHGFERDSSTANDKAAADAWRRTLEFFGR